MKAKVRFYAVRRDGNWSKGIVEVHINKPSGDPMELFEAAEKELKEQGFIGGTCEAILTHRWGVTE